MLCWLFEKPRGGGAEEGQDCRPAKNIDIGEQSGLLHHHAVEQAEGTGARGRRANVMAEISGHGGGLLLKNGIRWTEIGAEVGLVGGGAADEGRGGHRDSD